MATSTVFVYGHSGQITFPLEKHNAPFPLAKRTLGASYRPGLVVQHVGGYFLCTFEQNVRFPRGECGVLQVGHGFQKNLGDVGIAFETFKTNPQVLVCPHSNDFPTETGA
jgi:hypothetical protein